MTADDRGPFWLQGDEDGGVGLQCRLCDTGGAPVRYWLDPPASPCDVDKAAHAHQAEAHPGDAAAPCDLDWPLDPAQVAGWARQARWFLHSYYKYAFTFESSGTIAMPDDPEAREFTARATVSGDPADFYRLNAGGDEPDTWEALCYVRTPDLELRDGDQTLIVLTGGDLE